MKYKRLGDKRRECGERITERNKKEGGNKTIETRERYRDEGRETERVGRLTREDRTKQLHQDCQKQSAEATTPLLSSTPAGKGGSHWPPEQYPDGAEALWMGSSIQVA